MIKKIPNLHKARLRNIIIFVNLHFADWNFNFGISDRGWKKYFVKYPYSVWYITKNQDTVLSIS